MYAYLGIKTYLDATGYEFSRKPGHRAKINGMAIPFWNKTQARMVAKILKYPVRHIQPVTTGLDDGYAIWTGVRFVTRKEWLEAADVRGFDVKTFAFRTLP